MILISILAQFALVTTELPFESTKSIYVDMASEEHKGGNYLQQNPTGLVPALRLPNQQTIGESAAIVLLLGEQCDDGRFVPQPSDKERPDFLYWLMYMATSGYPTFARVGHPE